MSDDVSLVADFYLRFLHANFAFEPVELPAFLAELEAVLPLADDATIAQLLRGGWRERLCGAWYVAIHRLPRFAEQLGALLLASETGYAGQGYCVALARLGASAPLVIYLARYLPVADRIYDQDWALGALTVVDPVAAAAIPRDAATWGPMKPAQGIDRVAAAMRVLELRVAAAPPVVPVVPVVDDISGG